MKKYIVGLIICLLFFVSIIYLYIINKTNNYSKNLFYMDTYINIKINDINKNKARKALKEAENIFETYHNLTNRYDNNSQLYLFNHIDGEMQIDERLYELISYAYSWYYKSEGLFNINIGSAIDVWKKYRESGTGVPSRDELNIDIDINNIKLLDNNTISNNGANIDLGAVAKGYATNLVRVKFEELGINDYIINAGGNVLVGTKNKGEYKIGIESPLKDANIYQVVVGNKISIVTSGSYKRFYEYNGKLYHHIIDPNTLYPSEYMKSVTIICDDSAQADVLSTTLFLMPIEQGKKYLEQFPNAEAIWYSNDNQIIKSKGFEKYEQK